MSSFAAFWSKISKFCQQALWKYFFIKNCDCLHLNLETTPLKMTLSELSNWTIIYLTVRPSIAPFSFGNGAVDAGEVAQTSCIAVKGDAPLNISWHFRGASSANKTEALPDGVIVSPVGDRGNLLLINPVDFIHQGNYTCRIENAGGYDVHSSYLYVNGTYIQYPHAFCESIEMISFFLVLAISFSFNLMNHLH